MVAITDPAILVLILVLVATAIGIGFIFIKKQQRDTAPLTPEEISVSTGMATDQSGDEQYLASYRNQIIIMMVPVMGGMGLFAAIAIMVVSRFLDPTWGWVGLAISESAIITISTVAYYTLRDRVSAEKHLALTLHHMNPSERPTNRYFKIQGQAIVLRVPEIIRTFRAHQAYWRSLAQQQGEQRR